MTGDEVGDDFDWLGADETCVRCGLHWADCDC